MPAALTNKPSKEQLEQWYVTERRTLRQIAQILGCSTSPICKWLKEYNIAVRAGGVMINFDIPSSKQLYEWYVLQNKSSYKIAVLVGCHESTIIDYLKKNNIPIRKEKRELIIKGQKFGYWTVLSSDGFTSSGSRMYLCECQCGSKRTIDGSELRQGSSRSCGCNRQSKGELQIANILQRLNIPNIRQWRHPEIRNIKPLPLDFYLPSYNIGIEYDGEQHFEIKYHRDGEDGFKRLQKHDTIKTNKCKDIGIHLIRVTKQDNIEQRLREELLYE